MDSPKRDKNKEEMQATAVKKEMQAAAAKKEMQAATAMISMSTPDPAADDEKIDESLEVDTIFTNPRTKRHFTLKVAVKNGKWQVYVPRALHDKRRTYIQFSTGKGQSTQRSFGEFIRDRLEDLVGSWSNLRQAKSWCSKPECRTTWRDKLTKSWQTKLDRDLRSMSTSRKRKLTQVSPNIVDLTREDAPLRFASRMDRVDGAIVIPKYTDTPTQYHHTKFETIRVRRVSGLRRKGYVVVNIPRFLRRNGKRFLLKFYGFGAGKEWVNFVAAYVQYAVCNCESFHDLYNWCNNEIYTFAELVKAAYQAEGGNTSLHRFWTIKPSKTALDEVYVKAGHFPARGRVGAGLFCTRAGKWTIPFGGQGVITERVDKTKNKVSKQAGYYQVNTGEDSVDVPTREAFKAKVVHHGFIVNHQRNNPTHALDHEGDVAVLVPLRRTAKGEEFTFDYGYERSPEEETMPTSTSAGSESGSESESAASVTTPRVARFSPVASVPSGLGCRVKTPRFSKV